MSDILIKDTEYKQLDAIIGDIPTKYGLKLVQFFQIISQRRKTEEEILNKEKEKRKLSGSKIEDPEKK